MNPIVVIKENWLTRKPNPMALDITIVVSLLLFAVSGVFLNNSFQAQNWLSANGAQVFNEHQYWRMWTTLLIHADWGHFLSNVFLFIPLTYLLSAYYGFLLFPTFGFLAGGFINYFVLKSMPPEVTLLGVSGVVYWMGAVWLTLYVLVDHRESTKRRYARAMFLAILLFAPEAYKPQISYISHFYGFIFGVLCALTFYFLKRDDFRAAEVKEYIYETDDTASTSGPSESQA